MGAKKACDSLAKAIYANLCQNIIDTINANADVQNSMPYIGVLDVAGFGNLKKPSLPSCFMFIKHCLFNSIDVHI